MLETLRIKNIAVIDSAEIPFKPGLNILSGETGAGKSIVLEAISLILGGRASAELLRAECDEASVEGLFDLSELPWMKERLETHGFAADSSNAGNELLIKRTLSRSGKHRIHVNGELATVGILQELCEGLVDLCGQHEHQSLIRPAIQLELLDRFGGLSAQTRAVSEAYAKAKALLDQQTELSRQQEEREKRADFLSFQINELQGAELSPGEDEELQQKKQLLQSGELRAQTGEQARRLLEEEDGGLHALRAALSKIRQLGALDAKCAPIQAALERAVSEAEDASLELNRYLSAIDVDSEQLLQVQERLSLLADLRRKYGSGVEQMLTTLETLRAEAASLEQTGGRLTQLAGELKTAQDELLKLGRKLSGARKKAAETFAQAVTQELKDLKMGDARFAIELAAREDLAEWTPTGADLIQFAVQTNRGETSRPLGKIASGGELSRLMLAIRRVIADRGGIGVYLFDEIDAGIGGQTAFQVGKKLKSVAAFNQVLCITHLPQVASFADHHLVVRKQPKAKRTVTEVTELSRPERKEELARMLGGPELTKKSLENAAELMELAR